MIKLYIGAKFTGITVQPDPTWPNMWRVHSGTYVSDMVNLSRAKDAAIGEAARAGFVPGGTQRKVVNWKMPKRENGAGSGAFDLSP